jgi:hypothetical protein
VRFLALPLRRGHDLYGGDRVITWLTDEEREELSRKVSEANKRSQDQRK